MLGDEGATGKALEMIDRALQLDPLEAEFYYAKGKLLEKSGGSSDAGAAKQCLALAAEIAPESWKYAIAVAESDG